MLLETFVGHERHVEGGCALDLGASRRNWRHFAMLFAARSQLMKRIPVRVETALVWTAVWRFVAYDRMGRIAGRSLIRREHDILT